jgi:hypothetical protein
MNAPSGISHSKKKSILFRCLAKKDGKSDVFISEPPFGTIYGTRFALRICGKHGAWKALGI